MPYVKNFTTITTTEKNNVTSSGIIKYVKSLTITIIKKETIKSDNNKSILKSKQK